ncbi:MAG: DUF971 domain-containing protein [Nitrospirae bacterium]|nr:MAG: DUF971 domain-containing protein [Nitrospirota bacterium]
MSDKDATTLTAFTVEKDGRIRIEWADGAEFVYPASWVRFHCACAHCVDEWAGNRLVDPKTIPPDIRPTSAEPVGNYAVKIVWSDGHDTGYYGYDSLRAIPPAPEDWDAYLKGEKAWPKDDKAPA